MKYWRKCMAQCCIAIFLLTSINLFCTKKKTKKQISDISYLVLTYIENYQYHINNPIHGYNPKIIFYHFLNRNTKLREKIILNKQCVKFISFQKALNYCVNIGMISFDSIVAVTRYFENKNLESIEQLNKDLGISFYSKPGLILRGLPRYL